MEPHIEEDPTAWHTSAACQSSHVPCRVVGSPGYTADGTHPSAAGHAAMAGAVTTSVLV
jgi:lysophospholipase L1-like esterase